MDQIASMQPCPSKVQYTPGNCRGSGHVSSAAKDPGCVKTFARNQFADWFSHSQDHQRTSVERKEAMPSTDRAPGGTISRSCNRLVAFIPLFLAGSNTPKWSSRLRSRVLNCQPDVSDHVWCYAQEPGEFFSKVPTGAPYTESHCQSLSLLE
jgi:hypothetical protein